jgi:hypothetical protein
VCVGAGAQEPVVGSRAGVARRQLSQLLQYPLLAGGAGEIERASQPEFLRDGGEEILDRAAADRLEHLADVFWRVRDETHGAPESAEGPTSPGRPTSLVFGAPRGAPVGLLPAALVDVRAVGPGVEE